MAPYGSLEDPEDRLVQDSAPKAGRARQLFLAVAAVATGALASEAVSRAAAPRAAEFASDPRAEELAKERYGLDAVPIANGRRGAFLSTSGSYTLSSGTSSSGGAGAIVAGELPKAAATANRTALARAAAATTSNSIMAVPDGNATARRRHRLRDGRRHHPHGGKGVVRRPRGRAGDVRRHFDVGHERREGPRGIRGNDASRRRRGVV